MNAVIAPRRKKEKMNYHVSGSSHNFKTQDEKSYLGVGQ